MSPLRRRLSVSAAIAVLVAVTAAPVPAEAGAGTLQQVVDRLGELSTTFDSFSQAVMAISVLRLDTGEYASYRGDELFGPASAVKAVWILSAIEHSGIDAVASIQHAAIYSSDDIAAGTAIDLAGGLDAINEYVHGFGMDDTEFYEWNFPRQHIRRSSTFPGPARGRNMTTTDDLVTFWKTVAEGGLLDQSDLTSFLSWTSGPKAGGDANRIVARLPAEVAAVSSFKSGWLPIPREWQQADTEDGPGEIITLEARGVSIGAGIIVIPGGPAYAVAITAYDGRSWAGMTTWVEYASCVIYSAISGDPLRCSRTRDPRSVALDLAVPAGELLSVSSRFGALTVDGWAADPDSWMAPTLVRITVDGQPYGGVVAAVPGDSRHLETPRFHRLVPGEVAPGPHEVCASVLDDGGGDAVPIGCSTVDA